MTKRAPCRDTPKKYLVSSVHWTLYHMNEVYHGDRYIYNRVRDYRYPELWKDEETDWASWWNFHFTVRSPTTCFLLQPHFPSPTLLHCVSNTNSLLGRWVVINNRIPSGWEATRKKMMTSVKEALALGVEVKEHTKGSIQICITLWLEMSWC